VYIGLVTNTAPGHNCPCWKSA